MSKTIVIGNGVSGYTVASALSKAGKDVVQYSEEPFAFYSRIKLPQALCDDAALQALPSPQDAPFLVHQAVVSIDPEKKTVRLADGGSDTYDSLVLATGSRCRTLPLCKDVGNVSTLRTLSDAKRLSVEMKDPVCVLGGGLLGIEAARAISKKGFHVTVMEAAPHILNRQLNDEASAILRKKLEDEGLSIVEGFMLDKVATENGKITGVVSKEGRKVSCSTMILSMGVISETTLAREAGLTVNRGIVVDGKLMTSHKDIYAIGDCAEYQGMTPCIMPVALGMANTVASILLGKDVSYVPPELMTRLKDDAFDLVSIGTIAGDCMVEEEGEKRVYTFRDQDGILTGVILFNASARLMEMKGKLGKKG